MTQGFFVYGASGHAKVVVDAILASGGRVEFLVDDAADKINRLFFGIDVIGRETFFAQYKSTGSIIIAIGDNSIRRRIAMMLLSHQCQFGLVVHPLACVAASVTLGAGTFICAGAIINSDAQIGDHVIINTSASVDHDCTIGSFVHIAPGVRLCGGVTVGDNVLIGAGSIILPGITIGDSAIIGAGSVVIRDIPSNTMVAGNPARVLE